VSYAPKIIVVSVLSSLLSACSSLSGDWPNLADPYPDASQRERVVERANPVAPTLLEDESPLTRSGAFKLLESTKARIGNAQKAYQTIKGEIASAENDDKLDSWNEAQLLLTRLSHTLSRLDAILISEKLRDAPVWASALQIKNSLDGYLVNERKALAKLRP